MANVKINLSDESRINKVNIYSDIDVSSDYIENTIKDRKAIENSITNILKWKPRERIMNPSFGNTLWKRIFDNFSSFSKSDICSEVRRILSYEPRIRIKDVDVSTNIQNSELYVMFTYTIPEFDDSNGGSTLSTYSITISNA